MVPPDDATEGVRHMETTATNRPAGPQPTGAPRWVALHHRPASSSWQVCAESPHRAAVQYALGEMAQTARARGEDLTVSLWGPKDGAWHRYDVPTATATATAHATAQSEAAEPGPEPSKLEERMTSRRRQALMAGLGKAGLYDLAQ